MPSDSGPVSIGFGRRPEQGPPAPPPPVASPRWGWLRSQGLGLVCGFGTVLLLAIGSVSLAATRDGASAGVGLDDLRAFFEQPSWVHWWLYLLFPLAGLYALNTTLATWDNVARRWRGGQRAPAAYAAAVVHAGFLLALVAHAVGGFLSADRGQVVVTSGWQPLPAFGEVRLVTLEVDALPNGMPRSARAVLEVRPAGGAATGAAGTGAAAVERAEVGYNQPLSGGAGARLALLQDLGQVLVAHLASGEATCALAEGQSCVLAGQPVTVLRASPMPGGGGAAALVRAPGPDGALADRWLAGDQLAVLAGGRPLALQRLAPEPAILLRVREAPGNPWALAAALVLALGTALMWRRLWR
jgi:hypothetical protein